MVCLSLLFIWGVNGQTQLQNSIGYINLQVNYKGPVTDTIIVVMQNVLYPGLDNLHHRSIKADRISGQQFFFRIPVEDSSGYLSIAKILPEKIRKSYDLKGIFTDCLWEIGDDVKIGIYFPFHERRPEWAEFSFEGKGSAKYQVKNELKNLYLRDVPYADMKDSIFRNGDSLALEKVSHIFQKFSPKISYKSLQIMKADNLYKRDHGGSVSVFSGAVKDSVQRKMLVQNFDSIVFNINIPRQDKKYYKYSIKYPRYYLNALFAQTVAYYGKKRPSLVFRKILKESDQELKEKLLVMFFLRNDGDDSTTVHYKNALQIIKSKKYRIALEEIRAKYEYAALGNYIFEDIKGNSVNLASYKGKVVLIDLWFTGCGGCAYFYEHTVSKVEEYFKDNRDFKVVSICVDKRTMLWKEGIASGLYTSEKGADNLHIGKLGVRHPFISDFNIPGMPCAILINKQGYIEQFNTTLLYSESSLKNEVTQLLKKQLGL